METQRPRRVTKALKTQLAKLGLKKILVTWIT